MICRKHGELQEKDTATWGKNNLKFCRLCDILRKRGYRRNLDDKENLQKLTSNISKDRSEKHLEKLKRRRERYAKNKDREKINKYVRDKYKARNKKAIFLVDDFKKKYPNKKEAYKEYRKYCIGVDRLSDNYIKGRICHGTNLSHKDIPKELVELARNRMKIKRFIYKERGKL